MGGLKISIGRTTIWFTPLCPQKRCPEKKCRKNFTIATEAFSALGVEGSGDFSQGKK